MRIVRRYINTQIFKAVSFVTCGFLALFAFFDVLNDLSFTSRTANRYGIGNSLAYIVMLLPGHTYELLPIAVLIGAVFVMANLAQTSEFTIFRTSGLGPWRALRSLLGLGLLFTAATFLIGDYIAPRTEKLAQYYKARFEGSVTKGHTGAWIKESINGQDRIVNVQELTADGQMRKVRMFDFDAQGFLSQLRRAESATFADGQWQLNEVSQHLFIIENGQQTRVTRQQAPTETVETGIVQTMVAAALLKPDRMSTLELYQYIRHLKQNKQSADLYEIRFWRKLFYPLSCLVMIVLALPFAYLHFRSGIITTAMFAGIIVGISFFLLNNVFEYVGNLRAWAPWFIAAVPSLAYMLASLLAFRWLVRNR
ncbi:MAG: LPS export ABC transporter permease LptG [Brachymonas sp.]|nr:LPS export ABC transporter permease LptG [Brachymonas sp.]